MKYLSVFLLLLSSFMLQGQSISEQTLYGTWNYRTFVLDEEENGGGSIVEGEISFNRDKTYRYTGVAYHPFFTFIKVEMELTGAWELVTSKQLVLRFGKITFPQLPAKYHKYIDVFMENFEGLPDVTKVIGYKNGTLLLRDSMGEKFVFYKGEQPFNSVKVMDKFWLDLLDKVTRDK